jgi:hypothetical protein
MIAHRFVPDLAFGIVELKGKRIVALWAFITDLSYSREVFFLTDEITAHGIPLKFDLPCITDLRPKGISFTGCVLWALLCTNQNLCSDGVFSGPPFILQRVRPGYPFFNRPASGRHDHRARPTVSVEKI